MSLGSYVPGTSAWRRRREGILCAKTVERIQEIVDGEISGTRAVRIIERHLEICHSCQLEADVVRNLKIAISRVGRDVDADAVGKLNELARKLCEGKQPD